MSYSYRFPGLIAASGTQLWQVRQEVWIDDFDPLQKLVLVCIVHQAYGGKGFTRAEVRERVTK